MLLTDRKKREQLGREAERCRSKMIACEVRCSVHDTRCSALVPCVVLLWIRPSIVIVPSGSGSTCRWPRRGVLRRSRLGLVVARWLPRSGVGRVNVSLSRVEAALLAIAVVVWCRFASTRLGHGLRNCLFCTWKTYVDFTIDGSHGKWRRADGFNESLKL